MTQLPYVVMVTGLLVEPKDITGSGPYRLYSQDYFVIPHVCTTPYTAKPEYLMESIIYHCHLQTPHNLGQDS